MPQLNAAQLAALVSFGQQEQIAAAQVFERLTQSTARQHTAVAEHIQRIYQDDIQVALQLPVLIAIVHNDNLGIQLFNGITSCNGTVFADDYRNTRQSLGHQVSFVTCFIGSHENLIAVGNYAQLLAPMRTVAAVQDNNAIAHRLDNCRHLLGGRSFTGAADGNITDRDNAAVQLFSVQQAAIIHRQLAANAEFV